MITSKFELSRFATIFNFTSVFTLTALYFSFLIVAVKG